ncbi:MAG: hypothetical protein FWD85_01435 [Microbacteriaceae bacterium]|nr:hypothetical protein [Microbacteriaceae bacterium]MCL2793950.1 hypothetical protein [Microbacteriaceae bacterium]
MEPKTQKKKLTHFNTHYGKSLTKGETAKGSVHVLPRYELVFPEVERSYVRYHQTLDDGTKWEFRESYENDVFDFLNRLGFRVLNDRHLAGLPLPEVATLQAVLDVVVYYFGEVTNDYDVGWGGKARGLSSSQADRQIERAAQAILRDWTPAWIEKRRDEGRKGGLHSKRTLEMLVRIAFGDLVSATRQEQADQLQVSLRTVDRLRADALALQVEAQVTPNFEILGWNEADTPFVDTPQWNRE